uniref:Trypsin inhibitor n=2 Tax=Toxoplasma gondii TaxID=5811 RepID=Q95UY9_TOXGO|nr:trypsin inhibitor [Toxoplasma gondii]
MKSKCTAVLMVACLLPLRCNGMAAERQTLCMCPKIFDPQCGVNGKTYANECERVCANVDSLTTGPCDQTEKKLEEAELVPTHESLEECINKCDWTFMPVCDVTAQTWGNMFYLECGGRKPAHPGPCTPAEVEVAAAPLGWRGPIPGPTHKHEDSYCDTCQRTKKDLRVPCCCCIRLRHGRKNVRKRMHSRLPRCRPASSGTLQGIRSPDCAGKMPLRQILHSDVRRRRQDIPESVLLAMLWSQEAARWHMLELIEEMKKNSKLSVLRTEELAEKVSQFRCNLSGDSRELWAWEHMSFVSVARVSWKCIFVKCHMLITPRLYIPLE